MFDQGYWQIDVDVAKGGPDEMCWRVTVRNRSEQTETLHVLPTTWFRNTWAWGRDDRTPRLWWQDGAVQADHEFLGRYELRSNADHQALFCDNETNTTRLYGSDATPAFAKDGIGEHVVHGAPTVNPHLVGTKASLHHQLVVPAGGSQTIELRFGRPGAETAPLGDVTDAPEPFDQRRQDADEFYAAVIPAHVDDEDRSIARQAFAGLCWSKQWFHYDVGHWLDGDPAGPAPPPGRGDIRNGRWRHLRNADVVLMPDPWEYPWFATWDLAFHCVAYAPRSRVRQGSTRSVRSGVVHAPGRATARL